MCSRVVLNSFPQPHTNYMGHVHRTAVFGTFSVLCTDLIRFTVGTVAASTLFMPSVEYEVSFPSIFHEGLKKLGRPLRLRGFSF
jgi:hypothetical protein